MSSNPEFSNEYLPRILIIDDQWGSVYPNGKRNSARFSFCQKMGLIDESPDSRRDPIPESPIARVVFARGQTPVCATEGSVVENSIPETLKIVRSGWENCAPQDRWAAIFVDMEFLTGKVTKGSQEDYYPGKPEGCKRDRIPETYFGLDLLDAIAAEFSHADQRYAGRPKIPLVILSANAALKDRINKRYHQAGVTEFLPKDAGKGEMHSLIWHHGLVTDDAGIIQGFSFALLTELKEARLFAASRFANILIYGETGTGKEPLADYIMRWSSKSTNAQQLAPMRCPNFTETLAESQLFGHVKGAFTGADKDRVGLIENAKGGDLFLDEIARLPRLVQSKLLNVLENKPYYRLGDEGGKEFRSDVRFIAASNMNLVELASRNEFHHDLPRRFTTVLCLPPLRERLEDLPFIVKGLLTRWDHQRTEPREVSKDLYDHLSTYDWPDNIGELENSIKKAISRAPEAPILVPRDIPLPSRNTTVAVNASNQASTLGAMQTENVEQPQTALNHLLDQMKSVTLTRTVKEDLESSWVKLRSATAKLAAKLLEQCLTQTADGKTPNLTRAYRLMTGEEVADSNKNKPGDLVRDIREIDEHAIQDFLSGGTKLSVVNSDLVKRPRYRKTANTDLGKAIMSALVSIQNDTNALALINQARLASKALDDYLRIWQGAECIPTGVVAVGFAAELLRAAPGDELLAYLAKVKELLGERVELSP